MTAEFWVELMSPRTGLFGPYPVHGFFHHCSTFCGLPSGRGHSLSAYLRGDQSGEHEGNKQVGAVNPENNAAFCRNS